jgi:aryl-alcohol dehydrogenase-like predicted oxidoreductase
MEYRFLGSTGVRVSSVALGTMAFGGDADADTSEAIFRHCLDAGVNLFDCADVYAGGRSESLLGTFIRGVRDDIVLTTKAYFPVRDTPNARGTSRYHLVRAVEASLKRLATDRIDVFFLHRWDDATDIEETLRGVEMLVQSGKILYPAASNFAAWQTMKALGVAQARGWAPLTCIQPMYNLVKRQAESELLPMAASEGLGVLPYSPLGGGLLSGKYGASTRPDAGRLVDNKMYATRYGAASNFAVAEAFTALAADAGVHPVTLAIAWVRAHPAVTAPLIGGRSVEQLEPALAAATYTLPADLKAQLDALSAAPALATDRNEESSDNNYGAR